MMTSIKTLEQQEAMRQGGHMLASVLRFIKQISSPGMTTKHLDDEAKKELSKLGGQPAFLGYQRFPGVLCVSLNDEVVHGIPSPHRKLSEGDIVSIDFGVKYRGLITDAACSFILGKATSPEVNKLVKVTEESMHKGIEQVRNGARTGDIGAAIQEHLQKYNLGVVRELVGHGVGENLHEEPNIPNYGLKNSGPVLKSGMTIAIEPMSTLGDYRVFVAEDEWTVKTRDGSLSAHFEHTILVKDDGSEILTI